VTIIVGIICKDAIILASDSQTTSGGMKRTDAEKIISVRFDNDCVLVAQAGNAGNSARAIEILSDMAKHKKISDYRTPADLARSAMMKVKEELRQQYCNCTVEELQDFIWKDEQQSELMLAYYFKGKPYIFKLDLAIGRADKENSHYAAIGCAANLGSYLLSEHTNPNMECGLASVLAIYIIETVCKHDAYCSPPARVGLIKYIALDHINSGFGSTLIYTQRSIKTLAAITEAIMGKSKQPRNRQIEKAIVKQTRATVLAMLLGDKITEIFSNSEKKEK
jgi:20S proteasome alpha/beta subunit